MCRIEIVSFCNILNFTLTCVSSPPYINNFINMVSIKDLKCEALYFASSACLVSERMLNRLETLSREKLKRVKKSLAYGRHQISQPMRIDTYIFFVWKKINSPERPLFFRALQVGPQMHQSIREILVGMVIRVTSGHWKFRTANCIILEHLKIIIETIRNSCWIKWCPSFNL